MKLTLVKACKWILHKLTADLVHFHSWFETFLFNSEQFVRDAFVSFVIKLLKTVHPTEAALFPTSYVTEEISLVEGYGAYSNEPIVIFEEAYQERQANNKDKDKQAQQSSGALSLKELFATPTIKTCIDSVLAMASIQIPRSNRLLNHLIDGVLSNAVAPIPSVLAATKRNHSARPRRETVLVLEGNPLVPN